MGLSDMINDLKAKITGSRSSATSSAKATVDKAAADASNTDFEDTGRCQKSDGG